MAPKNYILSKAEAAHRLNRMVLELAEHLSGDDTPVVIIGVRNNGTVIAEKAGALLKTHVQNKIQTISVSLDKSNPGEVTLSEQIDLNNLNVVIADDVTNSGRTLLYALKPLLQFRPRSIQMLVLVERMHKLFPVKPDYVGLSIATTLQDHIQVEVEGGEILGAYVV
ncbi:MAG: phosphoribosyltransferase [Chitinophagaceae bacterium]|nr:phosphoribosyltransferase [Chitinophagaceae bacterium]